MNPAEEWRAVPGHEGFYEVSSLGRVRSLRHGRGTRREPRILKGAVSRVGYVLYWLRGRVVTAARIVLSAFVGPQPEGATADHRNRVRTDNRVENLRWATLAEQTENRGPTERLGEEHGNARITAEVVVAIRRSRRAGEMPSAIAARLGLTTGHVSAVASGRLWSHIGEPVVAPILPTVETLAPEVRADIVRRSAAGESQRSIARALGLGRAVIRQALLGSAYRKSRASAAAEPAKAAS